VAQELKADDTRLKEIAKKGGAKNIIAVMQAVKLFTAIAKEYGISYEQATTKEIATKEGDRVRALAQKMEVSPKSLLMFAVEGRKATKEYIKEKKRIEEIKKREMPIDDYEEVDLEVQEEVRSLKKKISEHSDDNKSSIGKKVVAGLLVGVIIGGGYLYKQNPELINDLVSQYIEADRKMEQKPLNKNKIVHDNIVSTQKTNDHIATTPILKKEKSKKDRNITVIKKKVNNKKDIEKQKVEKIVSKAKRLTNETIKTAEDKAKEASKAASLSKQKEIVKIDKITKETKDKVIKSKNAHTLPQKPLPEKIDIRLPKKKKEANACRVLPKVTEKAVVYYIKEKGTYIPASKKKEWEKTKALHLDNKIVALSIDEKNGFVEVEKGKYIPEEAFLTCIPIEE